TRLDDAPAVDAAARAHVAELADAMRSRVTGPFAEAAKAAGFEVRHAGSLVPIVYLDGNEAELRAWLASRAEVIHVAPDLPAQPELTTSVKTTRADLLWSGPAGLSGAGTRAADIEQGSISSANPYLPAGTVFQTSESPIAHATAIGGIIASNHPTARGMAPGAHLLSANASSSESGVIAGVEWALANGADICNISLWTNLSSPPVLTLGDMAIDYIVRNSARMIVKSAGNQGIGNVVTSPGRGWSCIAVGNFDDRGTTSWADDVMNPGSSTKDPTTGAPKPEVSAPGTDIVTTTTSAPWIADAGSGTSYAAPHVVGGSLLLFEKMPALRAQPELLKALWIATAWHNVEGATDLSDQDGAGGIDVFAAAAVIGAGRLQTGMILKPDIDAAAHLDFPVALVAGNRARIAASWDSTVASPPAYSPDSLLCRFDLQLLPPGDATPLATATHPGAAWRILEVVPPVTGTYTVRLQKVQFDGPREPFGIAVSQVFDAYTSTLEGSTTQFIGTTATMTARDPYHPGASFAAIASLSGGSYELGIPVAQLPRVIPVVADDIAFASVSGGAGIFGGFVGNLSATGTASLTVTVPALPLLTGLKFTYTFLTLQPGAPDGVREIAPPLKTTLTSMFLP
ncbi:MAG TPA: S8 family serine peptidase, partial [Planctomycetota bacterium]|nr:S8 family serine peptidase [Planctomycetota bacterium]